MIIATNTGDSTETRAKNAIMSGEMIVIKITDGTIIIKVGMVIRITSHEGCVINNIHAETEATPITRSHAGFEIQMVLIKIRKRKIIQW